MKMRTVTCPTCKGRGKIDHGYGMLLACLDCGGGGTIKVEDTCVYFVSQEDGRCYQISGDDEND